MGFSRFAPLAPVRANSVLEFRELGEPVINAYCIYKYRRTNLETLGSVMLRMNRLLKFL